MPSEPASPESGPEATTAPAITPLRCIDCPEDSKRPARRPGPRCATHMRELSKRQKRNAWAARIEKTYGITAAEYEAILRIQGGKCAVCKRATGATRMLSVDHNHQLPPGRESVRGLLCRPCNDMVGRMRDEADAFYRAFHYLRFPPARKVLSDQGYPLPNAE